MSNPSTRRRKARTVIHDVCLQEKKITELNDAINGNGQEGMKITLTRQEEHIKVILSTLQGMDKKYDDTLIGINRVKKSLDIYKAEMDGARKQQEEIDKLKKEALEAEERELEITERGSSHKRWRRGLLITTLMTLLTLLFFIYKDIRDNNKIKIEMQKESQSKK